MVATLPQQHKTTRAIFWMFSELTLSRVSPENPDHLQNTCEHQPHKIK
jgi:hypothetical protein